MYMQFCREALEKPHCFLPVPEIDIPLELGKTAYFMHVV